MTITNMLGQELYQQIVTDDNGTRTLVLQESWQGTLFATFEVQPKKY